MDYNMDYIDISFLGILFNMISLFIISVLSVLITLANIGNARFHMDLMKVNEKLSKVEFLKREIKRKKRTYLDYKNFLFFFPFSGLLIILIILYNSSRLLQFFYDLLEEEEKNIRKFIKDKDLDIL